MSSYAASPAGASVSNTGFGRINVKSGVDVFGDALNVGANEVERIRAGVRVTRTVRTMTGRILVSQFSRIHDEVNSRVIQGFRWLIALLLVHSEMKFRAEHNKNKSFKKASS